MDETRRGRGRRSTYFAALVAMAAILVGAPPLAPPMAPGAPGLSSPAGAQPSVAGLSERGVVLPLWSVTEANLGDVEADLDAIAAAGADAVTLLPTSFTRNRFTAWIRPKSDGATPKLTVVGQVIDAAHARGLSVTLKPHVDLYSGTPRLFWKAQNQDLFWTNYLSLIHI